MTESSEQNQQQKNTVTNSIIGAGQNLHVGDIHYHRADQTDTNNRKPAWGIWQKRGIGLVLTAILLIVIKYTDCNPVELRSDGTTYENSDARQPSVSKMPPTAGKTNDSLLSSRPVRPAGPQSKSRDSDKEMAGLITDSDTGQPLSGVQVVAVGTEKDFVTGETGRFRLFLDRVGDNREVRLYFYKQGYASWEETFYQVPKTDIRPVLKKEKQEQ